MNLHAQKVYHEAYMIRQSGRELLTKAIYSLQFLMVINLWDMIEWSIQVMSNVYFIQYPSS
jgi:hypothetical protein